MASKFSEALAKAIAGDQPWDAVLRNGKFLLFSGAVPALPEDAVPVGQLVSALTLDDGAFTPATQATMTVTFTTINIGNTVRITVGGIPIHPLYTSATADEPTAAAALVASINKSPYSMGVRASVTGSVVTLSAPYGVGTIFNGAVVANTGAGGTVALSGNFAGGVDAINGLTWERDDTVLNKLIQPATEVWSGTCPGTVTVPTTTTFFRYILDSGDNGYSLDSTKVFRRVQGSIGTSSNTAAEMTFPLANTSLIAGIKLVVTDYTLTIPIA